MNTTPNIENMIKETKDAKTILKKFFMLKFDVKYNTRKIVGTKIGLRCKIMDIWATFIILV
jgi:hypothetical protein